MLSRPSNVSATVAPDYFEAVSIPITNSYYASIPGRKSLDDFLFEMKHLARLRHKNLVSVYSAQIFEENPRQLVLFRQHCHGDTLHEVVKRSGNIDFDMAVQYMKSILLALNILHSNNIIHKGISLILRFLNEISILLFLILCACYLRIQRFH